MKSNQWGLGGIAGNVAALLLAFLVVMAVSAVGFRYLVGAPLAWAEEVETITMMWIIMIGLIYGKSRNSLLRMDILYNLMPLNAQRWVSIFQELVHCLLFCLMAYYGYKLAIQVGNKGTSILDMPLKYMYFSLPVGAAGALLISLGQLYGLVRNQEGK